MIDFAFPEIPQNLLQFLEDDGLHALRLVDISKTISKFMFGGKLKPMRHFSMEKFPLRKEFPNEDTSDIFFDSNAKRKQDFFHDELLSWWRDIFDLACMWLLQPSISRLTFQF